MAKRKLTEQEKANLRGSVLNGRIGGTGSRTLNKVAARHASMATPTRLEGPASGLAGPTPVNAQDHANRVWRDETRGMTPEQLRLYTEQKQSDIRVKAQEQIDRNRIQTRQSERRTLGNQTQTNETNVVDPTLVAPIQGNTGIDGLFVDQNGRVVNAESGVSGTFTNGEQLVVNDATQGSLTRKTMRDKYRKELAGKLDKLRVAFEGIDERNGKYTKAEIPSVRQALVDDAMRLKQMYESEDYASFDAYVDSAGNILDEVEEKSPYAEGQGVGDSWWDEDQITGTRYKITRDHNGNQKILATINPPAVQPVVQTGFDGFDYKHQDSIIGRLIESGLSYEQALTKARSLYPSDEAKQQLVDGVDNIKSFGQRFFEGIGNIFKGKKGEKPNTATEEKKQEEPVSEQGDQALQKETKLTGQIYTDQLVLFEQELSKLKNEHSRSYGRNRKKLNNEINNLQNVIKVMKKKQQNEEPAKSETYDNSVQIEKLDEQIIDLQQRYFKAKNAPLSDPRIVDELQRQWDMAEKKRDELKLMKDM